eukprot:TRINITY_DN111651_c0_g1_i1.p2 TRINITY_DN111651_c0_g1~~TRINITY_DN111651_c0_g1_i1.p2  ORF type:complete len:199 (-),score=42.35 TRINITY_DN111651_c0_g1_i1:305-901(-)
MGKLTAQLSKDGAPGPPPEETIMPLLTEIVQCTSKEPVHVSLLSSCNLVGVYFSASWCPPCKAFTRILCDAHKSIRESLGERAFQIVLIPMDKEQAAWNVYSSSMPWLSVPIENRETILRLFMKFAISTIPRLIILDGSGQVVSEDARGGEGFGFGCDPLEAYGKLLEKSQALGGQSGVSSKHSTQQGATLARAAGVL